MRYLPQNYRKVKKQMKTIQSDIKEYLHQTKMLLPLYKQPEKLLIRELSDSIDAYVDEHPNANIEDIKQHFGSPVEIAQGYINTLDIETLINRISVRKMLRWIIIISLITAVIGLSIFGGFYYKGYQYYKNTVVVENDTTLINN